jgi:hypothetical protein
MEKEEYKEQIKKIVDETTDESTLRRIYLFLITITGADH